MKKLFLGPFLTYSTLIGSICALLAACGGGGGATAEAPKPGDPFSGFQIDISAVSADQRANVTTQYVQQIKVIQDANLPASMYAFMQTVPVVVDPNLPLSDTPALFASPAGAGAGIGVVKGYTGPMPLDKPILLHEMLHAYDWNYWKFAKPEVLQAYRQAINQTIYPNAQNSHFLENAREYFAIAGTVYLVGTIQQAPFNCTQMALRQSEFVAFLETTFGKHPYCN